MMDAEWKVSLPGGPAVAGVRKRVDADRMAGAWPLGMVELEGEVYGLVLASENEQAWAVKFQLPDASSEWAGAALPVLRTLAAGAAAELARQGERGLVLPTVYWREKGEGRVEIGVAVFGWPEGGQEDFAAWIWKAATRAAKALPTEIPGVATPELPPFLGMDLRPQSALGDVFLDAGVLDGELLLLVESVPVGEDPLWAALGGPESIRHVPMIAVDMGAEGGG